jgi:hypothetical protein
MGPADVHSQGREASAVGRGRRRRRGGWPDAQLQPRNGSLRPHLGRGHGGLGTGHLVAVGSHVEPAGGERGRSIAVGARAERGYWLHGRAAIAAVHATRLGPGLTGHVHRRPESAIHGSGEYCRRVSLSSKVHHSTLPTSTDKHPCTPNCRFALRPPLLFSPSCRLISDSRRSRRRITPLGRRRSCTCRWLAGRSRPAASSRRCRGQAPAGQRRSRRRRGTAAPGTSWARR